MSDDDGAAFDAELRKRARVGRKLTLNAETDEQRDTQAAFGKALASATNRAGEIRRRLFGEPIAADETAP